MLTFDFNCYININISESNIRLGTDHLNWRGGWGGVMVFGFLFRS
jgi:hypothetical protein